MGFYSQVILPQLMDLTMSRSAFAAYRQSVLANVQGEILEIGFGTGLNLSYYPSHVSKLTTIDVNPGMNRLAERRVHQSNITVDNRVVNGETLPMVDNTFDSVVSTWTLCSIKNVEQALEEIYRVLKPGGKFFFIEHGLSEKEAVQIWQRRLTPIQKVIADGCHLDRNIQVLVEKQFDHVELERFTPPKMPEVAAHLYKGVATKATVPMS